MFFSLFLTFLGSANFPAFRNWVAIALTIMLALAKIAPPQRMIPQWKIVVASSSFGCAISYVLPTVDYPGIDVRIPTYLVGNLSILIFLLSYSYVAYMELCSVKEVKEIGPSLVKQEQALSRLKHYMSLLQGIDAKETRAKILVDIRDFLTELPYGKWSSDTRNVVNQLLEAITHEMQNEHSRTKCLDILSLIVSRADQRTKSRIREMFYKELERSYERGDKTERGHCLAIMQELESYGLAFMSRVLDQAMNVDSDQEFEEVFGKIRLYRMSKADLIELQRNLVVKRNKLELSGEAGSKLKTRVDTVLTTLRQLV